MAQQIKIVKGEDITVRLNVKDGITKEPFSLAGFTAATGFLPTDTGSIAASGTLISSDLGRLEFSYSESDTAQMSAGDENNMEVWIDRGAVRNILQFPGQVVINEKLF